MAHEFTDEDLDEPVRTAEGERIGTVSEVNEGRARVESDEGLTDAIREKLDWTDDETTHELSDAAIDRVDDDGVWIRQI